VRTIRAGLFNKRVEEVVLHATVVDEWGHLVTSLDRGAFSVFVNGVPEPITSFHREAVPVAKGIVIDIPARCGTNGNQAVLSLIRASHPPDEIFVVNFSQTPYLDQDFTSDISCSRRPCIRSRRGAAPLFTTRWLRPRSICKIIPT
jgi:hypothetical protein